MDGIAADEPVGSSSASSKGPGSTKGLTQRGALENPQGSRESYTHHLFPLREWWYLGTSCRSSEFPGLKHTSHPLFTSLATDSNGLATSIALNVPVPATLDPSWFPMVTLGWQIPCTLTGAPLALVYGKSEVLSTSKPFSWHNSTGKHDVAAPLSTVAHTTFKAAWEFSPWLRKFISESELVSSYLNRFRWWSSLLSSLPSSLRPRSSFIRTSRVPSSGDGDLSRSRSSRLSRISRGIKLIGSMPGGSSSGLGPLLRSDFLALMLWSASSAALFTALSIPPDGVLDRDFNRIGLAFTLGTSLTWNVVMVSTTSPFLGFTIWASLIGNGMEVPRVGGGKVDGGTSFIRITTLWLHVSPKTVGFQPSDSFVAPEATHIDFTFAILLPLTQSMDLTKGFQAPIRSIDPMGNILWWIGTYLRWCWSHLLILFLGIGLLDSFSLLFLTIQPFTLFLLKGSPLLSFNLLGNSPLSLIFFTTHLAYHLCIRPLFLSSFLFLSFTAL